MSWSLNRASDPNTEPITLATAKLHLKVDTTDDDDLISGLITAAREQCEAFTNRTIGVQTFVQSQDRFDCRTVRLMAAPLVSVDSVTYVDWNGNTQTLANIAYTISTPDNAAGSISAVYGTVFPPVRCQIGAVQVAFTAGSAPAQSLIAGMLLFIGHLYEHREAVVLDASATVLPLAVESLWTPFKVFL